MPIKLFRALAGGVALSLLSACASTALNSPESKNSANAGLSASALDVPFASSYKIPESSPSIVRNATIWTGTGEQMLESDIVFVDGKITAIGKELSAPDDAQVIDGSGMFITPGIIDVHSHMGVYPTPSVPSHEDGNEIVAPATAKVWAEHSVWPQDPNFEKAIAGGVTTVQILPGSANLFGGRGVVLKLSLITHLTLPTIYSV